MSESLFLKKSYYLEIVYNSLHERLLLNLISQSNIKSPFYRMSFGIGCVTFEKEK